jgi:Peptidase A4 family
LNFLKRGEKAMLPVRLGLLVTLGLASVFAQVSNISILEDDTKLAPRQLGLIRDKLEHSNGTAESTNWSGYAVLGSAFTSARASWVVPAAVCTGVSGDEYSAFWVGLDGYSSSTVEQTGTLSDCSGRYPVYYAWYEFYPNPSYEVVSVPVAPGNVMSATVVYKGGAFTIAITNESTGRSFSKTASVPAAARSSAEWIVEAPCCTFNGGILPLSDFGTAYFGADYTSQAGTDDATDSTNSGPIGSFGTASVTQITKTGTSSSPQTSTCSVLSGDGTSFSCTWGQ